MVGHGGSSAGSYLADPTSPIPSHCASIVATSTLRVNHLLISVPKQHHTNQYNSFIGLISLDTNNGHSILTLTVLVATTDAQWEGMGNIGSARYEPALLPPCPTIRVLGYNN